MVEIENPVETRRSQLSDERGGEFVGYNDPILAKEGWVPHSFDLREGIANYPGSQIASCFQNESLPTNPNNPLPPVVNNFNTQQSSSPLNLPAADPAVAKVG